jgi:hypothetical protein
MAKFKVGDMVNIKFSELCRFHITGVTEDTCSAGTQVHYTGRIFVRQNIYDEGKKVVWEPAVKESQQRYHEIELGEIVEG